jgi:hypothetical protein
MICKMCGKFIPPDDSIIFAGGGGYETKHGLVCSTTCAREIEKLEFPLSPEKLKHRKSALNVQVGGQHYKEMAIQPIEFCHKNHMGACETMAIKYISRHKVKDGKKDLEKAIHSIQLLIELEYVNEN